MVGSALAALGSWLLCPHCPALPDISGHLRLTMSLSWVMTPPSLCRSDPGVSFTSLCHPIFSHCSHFLPLAPCGSLRTPFKWAPCFTLLLGLSPTAALVF